VLHLKLEAFTEANYDDCMHRAPTNILGSFNMSCGYTSKPQGEFLMKDNYMKRTAT